MIRLTRLLRYSLLLGLLAHPAAAYAAPGDPAPGSPSGAVYELPLEQGRSDAAPRGTGATAGGGSHYRSENDFGSSSRVPGHTAGEESGGGSTNGIDTDAAGTGGSGGGAGGTGTGEAGGDDASGSEKSAAGVQVVDTGNTSTAAALGLLAAIGAVAVAIGVLTARGGRLRAR